MTRRDIASENCDRAAWIAELPKWPITFAACEALPEYSATVPTGTTPGRLWRREDGAHDREFVRRGGKPVWLICQYDPACPPDAKTIAIHRYRPLIRVPAGRRVVPAVIVHRHTNINVSGEVS